MTANPQQILILGASGYIGGHLHRHLGPRHSVATFSRSPIANALKFDVLNTRLKNVLKQPDRVSHAVILLGETYADTCAKEPEQSRAINVDGIIAVIEDLVDLDIKPIFVSSDNVFDGYAGCYSETDIAKPIIIYGQQKLEVEQYLEQNHLDFCVVRLSKVYGIAPGDKTMFTAWHNMIQNGEKIRVANDQVISPVFIDDVVEGFLRLIRQNLQGIFHLCGPDRFSRFELLNELVSHTEPYFPNTPVIEACSINDFGLAEIRPLSISMVPTKFQRETGLILRATRELLPTLVRNFQNQNNTVLHPLNNNRSEE